MPVDFNVIREATTAAEIINHLLLLKDEYEDLDPILNTIDNNNGKELSQILVEKAFNSEFREGQKLLECINEKYDNFLREATLTQSGKTLIHVAAELYDTCDHNILLDELIYTGDPDDISAIFFSDINDDPQDEYRNLTACGIACKIGMFGFIEYALEKLGLIPPPWLSVDPQDRTFYQICNNRSLHPNYINSNCYLNKYLDYIDNNGNTLLQIAVNQNDRFIVDLLIAAGARLQPLEQPDGTTIRIAYAIATNTATELINSMDNPALGFGVEAKKQKFSDMKYIINLLETSERIDKFMNQINQNPSYIAARLWLPSYRYNGILEIAFSATDNNFLSFLLNEGLVPDRFIPEPNHHSQRFFFQPNIFTVTLDYTNLDLTLIRELVAGNNGIRSRNYVANSLFINDGIIQLSFNNQEAADSLDREIRLRVAQWRQALQPVPTPLPIFLPPNP